MGKLFGQVKDSLELTITERIWGGIQEVAIANIFGLTDEEIYDAVINKSNVLDHVWGDLQIKIGKLNLRNLNF